MKKIVVLSFFFGLILACQTLMAQDLDPEQPKIELLSNEQIQEWNAKTIEDWGAFFGAQAESWNPFQMKFYEDVKIKALSEEDKDKYKAYTEEDWEKEFGGGMDTWKIHQLLFYSAILNLSVN